jgi:PAS domain S-box-containing protein
MDQFTMPKEEDAQRSLKNNEISHPAMENLYRAIADAMQCGIWVFDNAQHTLYTNPLISQMLGYSAAELNEKSLEGLLADNDARHLISLERDIQPQKRFELPLHHKNGQIVWCDTFLSRLNDVNGTPVGFMAQIKDVSEQHTTPFPALTVDKYYLKLLAQFPKSGVMIFDHDLRFHAVYGSFYREGLTPADIEGRIFSEVYPKEVTDALEIPMRQALQGEIVVMERQVLDRFHWLIFAPQQEENGRVTRAMVLIQNITERKLAEIALRESETLYRSIFNTYFDGLIITIDGVMVDINPAVETMTGYKQGELVGQPSDVIIPDEWRDIIHERIKNKHLERLESALLHKDGTIVPVETQAANIPYRGQMARLTALRDISERKEAEKQIRLLAAVVRDAKAFTALADLNGEVLYINPIGLQLVGLMAHEAPRMNLLDLFDQPEQTVQDWRDQMADSGRAVCEDRLMAHDGTSIPVERIISYVYDERQQPIAITTIAVDIRERQQLEAQRLESQRIQIELEKANEMREHKDFFISVVSHEFRTPLAVIRSSTDILQRHYNRLTPEKRETHFERVFTHIDKLTDMVGDMLLLSRSEMKGIEFMPQYCDIDMFCRDLIENLTRAYPHMKAEYIPQLQQKSFSIDGYLLEHVLWNLLGNAVKYSPTNGHVCLHLNQTETHLCFVVKDNGIGIPPQDVEHIFDPFHRASNVGSIVGTGMGLAIVKRFVELHGGVIECTSEIGTGTTFSVSIPIIESAEE